MADIFVSHSHEDRDRIDPIVQQLHADGYEVWWDVELRGGSVYAKEIEAQIEAAKAVIVVWSSASSESHWVADEAELARRSEKLVPILLDGDEAPIGFRQIQCIDFSNWSGLSDDGPMQALVETIAQLAGEKDSAAPSPRATSQPTQTDVDDVFEFSAPDRPSIAILPFKSLGSDPDQDYLADGIRFGIQATLVQLSGLFLVNAPTLNAYRDTELSTIAAGTELDVRYILEGAVQQAGNKVRATVQLIDVQDQQTVWAETYDRVLDDVFELQDEITREVVSALNVKLLNSESGRVWIGKLSSSEAREYYYRGSSYLYELNVHDNARAREMFEQLYSVQPDCVIGPSYVAITHWLDDFFAWNETPDKSSKLAIEWAIKAMKYEDNNGIGHAIYGYYQLLQGHYDSALETCSKSVELRASCPVAHGLLGLVLIYSGDPESAVSSAKEALKLERVYPPWLINVLATAYRDSGKLEYSIPAALESIKHQEGNEARLILCSDHMRMSKPDEARRVAEDIMASDPAFTLAAYAQSQPYKDSATLDNLISSFRSAGLPA